MHGNHLKHMLIGVGVVLAALLLVGLPFGTAFPYALLLACPLMLGAMMFMMMRGGSHDHGAPRDDDHQHSEADADRPRPRRPRPVRRRSSWRARGRGPSGMVPDAMKGDAVGSSGTVTPCL